MLSPWWARGGSLIPSYGLGVQYILYNQVKRKEQRGRKKKKEEEREETSVISTIHNIVKIIMKLER